MTTKETEQHTQYSHDSRPCVRAHYTAPCGSVDPLRSRSVVQVSLLREEGQVAEVRGKLRY